MGFDVSMKIEAEIRLYHVFMYLIENNYGDVSDNIPDNIYETQPLDLSAFDFLNYIKKWKIKTDVLDCKIKFRKGFIGTRLHTLQFCKILRQLSRYGYGPVPQKIFELYNDSKCTTDLQFNWLFNWTIDSFSSYKGRDYLDIDYRKIADTIENLESNFGDNIIIRTKLEQNW